MARYFLQDIQDLESVELSSVSVRVRIYIIQEGMRQMHLRLCGMHPYL